MSTVFYGFKAKNMGELNQQIGSMTDINNRVDSLNRNKYGETKRYPDF